MGFALMCCSIPRSAFVLQGCCSVYGRFSQAIARGLWGASRFPGGNIPAKLVHTQQFLVFTPSL
jgi:hypothetical protein